MHYMRVANSLFRVLRSSRLVDILEYGNTALFSTDA